MEIFKRDEANVGYACEENAGENAYEVRYRHVIEAVVIVVKFITVLT